jgi:hypothetical protein
LKKTSLAGTTKHWLMKLKAYTIVCIAALFVLLQSCSTTRRFGTTVERDEDNPCRVNIIIQIAVQGTEADVQAVKNDLDRCYSKECFIPCGGDSAKGCLTKTTVIVKRFANIPLDEQQYYHYVLMVDDDGHPSNADIGTPNSGASTGTWRRNAHPGTYCHEVLHFCGLTDQYCSRLYDPVTDSVRVELNCHVPPDPNSGNCCTPTAAHTRCSTPCSGHEEDLMATLSVGLSCGNIMEIVKAAGLDKCPPECCRSNQTFTQPVTEVYIVPGYMNFGDKSEKFGTYGGSVGATRYITPSIGITLEGGYYTHTEKNGELKQTSGVAHIDAGVNYRLDLSTNLTFNARAMGGIANYAQKTSFNNETDKTHKLSAMFDIGASLDLSLNHSWSIRILQVDYSPTFFYSDMQNNLKIGAGLIYKLPR